MMIYHRRKADDTLGEAVADCARAVCEKREPR